MLNVLDVDSMGISALLQTLVARNTTHDRTRPEVGRSCCGAIARAAANGEEPEGGQAADGGAALSRWRFTVRDRTAVREPRPERLRLAGPGRRAPGGPPR